MKSSEETVRCKELSPEDDMEQKRMDLFSIEASRLSLIKDVHRLKRERDLYSKRILQSKKDLDAYQKQLTSIDTQETKQLILRRQKKSAEARKLIEQKKEASTNELKVYELRLQAIDVEIESISLALSKLSVATNKTSPTGSKINNKQEDSGTSTDTKTSDGSTEDVDAVKKRFNQISLTILQGNKILNTFEKLLEVLTSSKSWSFADLILSTNFIVEEVKHERLEKSTKVIEELEGLFEFYNALLLSLEQRRIPFTVKKLKYSHKTMDYLMDDIISNIRVYDHVKAMLVAAHDLQSLVEDTQKRLSFMQKESNQELLRTSEPLD